MAQLLSVSRAANIVGVPRSAIQKKIRAGELHSFEGKIPLSQLIKAYPDTQLEEKALTEKIEKFVANALKRARYANYSKLFTPDTKTLATHVAQLNKQLSIANTKNYQYEQLLDKLFTHLDELKQSQTGNEKTINKLSEWLIYTMKNLPSFPETLTSALQQDDFLRITAAQVHLFPGDQAFYVEGRNSILESGLSAGLALNYGCNNSNCGQCKARLIRGDIRKIRQHDYVLTEAEKTQNYFLMCSCTAMTDIEIEAPTADSENDIPQQQLTTKVKKINPLKETDNILILTLKTQRTNRLRFLAGQQVKLTLPGNIQQTVAIASCPCDERYLEFHLQRDDSEFSSYVFNSLKVSDTINIEGPSGHFVLNEKSTRAIIFIATDTGFAPVKSLIEHAITLEDAETIHLYRINTLHGKPYLHNHCRAWNDALDSFSYTAINTEATLDTESFNRILCQLISDHPELSSMDIYITCPENLSATAKTFIMAQGLDEEQLRISGI